MISYLPRFRRTTSSSETVIFASETTKRKRMKKSIKNDIKKLGFPTITLKINGIPFRFIVDSGSSNNIMTKDAYDKVSSTAELVGQTSISGIDGVSSIQDFVKITYKMGDKEKTQGFGVLHSTPFEIFDKEKGIRIDGVLGLPFMLSNRVNLDYANMCIEYHPTK